MLMQLIEEYRKMKFYGANFMDGMKPLTTPAYDWTSLAKKSSTAFHIQAGTGSYCQMDEESVKRGSV
jgi:hypothetical protein